MYQLYSVNNKKNSNVKGFWIDKNNNNKLYIDNIHIEYHYSLPTDNINNLLNNGEECVFIKKIKSQFINGDKKAIAYIIGKDYKITLKKHRILKYNIYNDIDNIIINLLLKYEGITVHYKGINVIIEIWYN